MRRGIPVSGQHPDFIRTIQLAAAVSQLEAAERQQRGISEAVVQLPHCRGVSTAVRRSIQVQLAQTLGVQAGVGNLTTEVGRRCAEEHGVQELAGHVVALCRCPGAPAAASAGPGRSEDAAAVGAEAASVSAAAQDAFWVFEIREAALVQAHRGRAHRSGRGEWYNNSTIDLHLREPEEETCRRGTFRRLREAHPRAFVRGDRDQQAVVDAMLAPGPHLTWLWARLGEEGNPTDPGTCSWSPLVLS